jgi:hypothetical protein
MPQDSHTSDSSLSGASLANIVDEGRRLVELATTNNLTLRLLGGVAIAIRCPSAASGRLQRTYGDLDFASPRRTARQLRSMLESAGYSAERLFNAMHGDQRLIYQDEAQNRHLDIFVGTFRMCHELDLESRLELHPLTLSLADLLLTKLQIVKLNTKDAHDVLALLVDHPVVTDAPDAEAIDGGYIAGICARDWGWYTTVTDNLEKIAGIGVTLLVDAALEHASSRIRVLRSAIEAAPKSLKWRTRAALGRRVAWYEEPEEVRH